MTTDDYFDSLNELTSRLHSLDERGLVLTLSAYAEDSLADLLKAFMVQDSTAAKLVDGYDAPLGTFSARLRTAYAVRLLTKGQYHDLEHLRAIRNMFSHTWRTISFDDEAVRKNIDAMNYSNVVEKFPETPREKLSGSVSFLLVELRVAVSQVRKATKPHLGSRLVAGLNGSDEEQRAQCFRQLKMINAELAAAKAERKLFLKHLKRCWVEKCKRAISKSPEENWRKHLEELQVYATLEEINSSDIYGRDS